MLPYSLLLGTPSLISAARLEVSLVDTILPFSFTIRYPSSYGSTCLNLTHFLLFASSPNLNIVLSGSHIPS